MATFGWGTTGSVKEWLFEEGYRFDFYQAVRLLEAFYPGKVPVGETVDPRAEVVRFKSQVSFAFPASEIGEVHPPTEDGDPAMMTVNFMGIAGGLGPLPYPYTELILERIRLKDNALRDFLDIFNHRLVSLMYRVRKMHRVGLVLRSPEQSQTAGHLFALMGLGTRGLSGRMEMPDRPLLHYAGLLSHRQRSMPGLVAILADHFRVPVRGRQLCGRWLELEHEQTTGLGKAGWNRVLGDGAVLGTRVWDQAGRFTLFLGPMGFAAFLEFLPDGPGYLPLNALVRFYAGEEHDVTIVLAVKPEEAPGTRLGAANGTRLGWTSWLNSRQPTEGKFQVRLELLHTRGE